MGRLSYDLQPREYYRGRRRAGPTSPDCKRIAGRRLDLPVAGSSARASAVRAACVVRWHAT